MSFLNITDYKIRNKKVAEMESLRKKIINQLKVEKIGNQRLHEKRVQQFKPIIQAQEKLVEALKPPPPNIVFDQTRVPQLLDTPVPSDAPPPLPTILPTPVPVLGSIAQKYLSEMAFLPDRADKNFGITSRENSEQKYIGSKTVGVAGNDILMDDVKYPGTSGMWELITKHEPKKDIYNDKDLENYSKLMLASGALHKDFDLNSKKSRSNRGYKWINILSKVWSNRDKPKPSGSGVIFLSKNPQILLDRLDLLRASKNAGNTGVNNELVAIADELLSQKVLDKKTYKKIML